MPLIPWSTYHIDCGTDVHSIAIVSSKVFDWLNIILIIEELLKTRAPETIIMWFSQMLTCTYMMILFGESVSSEFKVENVTIQGGMLSPSLCNTCINYVIEGITKCSIGCQLGCFKPNILC